MQMICPLFSHMQIEKAGFLMMQLVCDMTEIFKVKIFIQPIIFCHTLKPGDQRSCERSPDILAL